MGKRFHLFPMVDLWMTIFASPGTRTGDSKAANYLITGPSWKGTVPKGMTHIPAATRYIVILGRTYADGTEADYKATNALQAQYRITPLSAWGKPSKPAPPPVDANPGISMTDKPQAVILAMGTEGYFNWLSRRMCTDAPATAADAPALARFARIGFQPCKPFSLARLDPAVQAALQDLPSTALGRIGANQQSLGVMVNGWQVTKGLGQYGTDYLKRAVVAAFGWPANLQQDAVYPNPLNKFTVSPRDNLKTNPDGSITLYLQKDSPGKDKEANWLPAPADDFIPMLRMYWPKDTAPSILNGSWTPPMVKWVQ